MVQAEVRFFRTERILILTTMNKGFTDYLSTLNESERCFACEAVGEYLKGESAYVERVSSPNDIYNVCRDMSLSNVEYADILLMNTDYRLIKRVRISVGGLSDTSMDVRVILKHCILNDATTLAVVHNHPSGSIRPSRDDNNITKKIQDACKIMRVYLLDHVIIGDGAYYSYREHDFSTLNV